MGDMKLHVTQCSTVSKLRKRETVKHTTQWPFLKNTLEKTHPVETYSILKKLNFVRFSYHN